MSLLRKLASLSPLQSPNSDAEKKNFEDAVLEPGSVDCLKMVDIHWNNAKAIMGLDEKTVGLQERFNILVYHLNEIVFVLVEEKEGDPGPCLQYVLDQGVFQSVYLWSVSNKNYLKDMQREQLRLFRNLIEKAKTHLLIYEQVWKPLLYLLHSCTNRISPDTEEHFVAVLKGLCVSANRDIALLDLFFLDNHHHGQIAKLSVFSLLIPFVHREANVGNWARDAMLLSMALSSVDARLGTYIAEETDFCPVLATGLSALYSLLPTSLDIPSEDWYSLERGLWATFPELVAFLTSLEFCNNVIQIAHPRVRGKLLNLVYHGFLVSVMAPALSQSSTEALMAATAYLDLFLRSITDANLMKVFVKFIMVEKSDGTPILDSLVSRIGHESQLAVISLGLFYTLLDLNCEDIMYTLVLRYLIPCTHILSSQKRTIKEVDLYSKSALKFLSLIPTSSEFNKSRSGSPTPSSSSENLNGTNHTPMKIDMKASSELVFYRTSLLYDLYADVCTDYMEYLADARVSLKDCQMRCSCWSAPYDGQTPAPQDVTSVDRQRSVSNSVTVANGSIPSQQFLATDTSLLPSKRSKSTCDSEQNECNQSLGPFLVTLFQKVERMPQNSFYVNLILTAVVTRLAVYPQPLLRSFLLNYNMVLKPGVRSLFQILSSVKIKLENLTEQIDELDKLLRRAKKNLVLREEKSRASIQSVVTDVKPKVSRHSEPRSPTTAQKLLKQRTDMFLLGTVRPLQDGPAPRKFGQNSPKLRKYSLGAQSSPKISRTNAERRASVSTSTSSLSLSGSCESLGSLSPGSSSNSDLTSDGLPKPGTVQKLNISFQLDGSSQKKTFPRNTFKRKNPKIVKNAVYCMVVLEHWLKELAAISQEQALLLVGGAEDSHV